MGKQWKQWLTLFFLVSKITADGDCSHEIKRHLLHGGRVVKNLPANAGDTGSILGSGRSPGVGNGNPLQYSCLEKFHGQRSLADYS